MISIPDTIGMSTVIFIVGSIVFFFVYSCCRGLYKNKSKIQTVEHNIFKCLVSLSPFIITLVLHFLTEIETYYNTIIMIAITCGMCGYIHNLFEIKENNDKKFQKININIKSLKDTLEETNKDYKSILCNPAYAFKANEKFSEKLQDESYRVTKHYYEKQDTLEARLRGELPDSGATVDQEAAKLLFSITSDKAISALNQFNSGKIFLRRKLYREFWENAVKYSNSYLSICDLSMYSGKDDSQIQSEKTKWISRVKNEIKALKNRGIKEFDKIILFESSQDDQNDNNNTIFNAVAELWEQSVQELGNLGIKSHCQSGNGNCMIWKFSREGFSSCLSHISQSDEVSGQINSNDLGIFGNYLIGEEFRINEASTIIGRVGYNDIDELKFLYRVSLQKELAEEIKDMAIKKMNCHCHRDQRD